MLGSVEVADGETERVAAVQLGVREKHLTRTVHFIEYSRVLVVAAVAQAETDDAERHWRRAFELGARVDPRHERARELHVAREMCAQSLGAEVADHHPEFQRPESPAELNPGIHQIADARLTFARFQILRRKRQRLPHDIHEAALEDEQLTSLNQ